MVHSGLQFGGDPMYVGKQEHEGAPPISRHSLLGPHGDGMHGFFIETSTAAAKIFYWEYKIVPVIFLYTKE